MKLAIGTKRSLVLLVRYSAVESLRPVVAMAVQLLPESVEYCQLPCVDGLAALAVIAIALSVSLSLSLNEDAKRSATATPAGLVLSSETLERAGLPLATGESFTLVTAEVALELTLSAVPCPSV